METMIEAKGAEYAAAWPGVIARSIGLSTDYVAIALVQAGLIDKGREMSVRRDFATAVLVPEVGALSPDDAKGIVRRVRETKQAIAEARKTACGYCGLKLNGRGECDECGAQD